MKITSLVSLSALLLPIPLMAKEASDNFPKAPLSEVATNYHGTMISDPYRGLEDPKNKEGVAWAKAYSDASMRVLKSSPDREQWIVDLEQASGQLGTSISSVHRAGSGTLYYLQRKSGEQGYKLWKRSPGGAPLMLIDPMPESGGTDQPTVIKSFSVSPTEKYFSCGIASGGDERSRLHVFDMATGKPLHDPIPRVRWGAATWLTDESGYFYRQLQELKAGMSRQQTFQRSQIMMRLFSDPTDRRVLGVGLNDSTEIKDSDLPAIYKRAGNDWILGLITTGVSQDHGFYLTKESELIAGKGVWKKVCGRSQQVGSSWGDCYAIHGDKLYLLTRKNAPNGKLIAVDLKNPDLSKAKTIYESKKGVVKSLYWAKDGVYLKVLEGGPSYFVGLPFGAMDKPVMIQTPEEGRVRRKSVSLAHEGLVFEFSSWKSPARIYTASIKQPEAEIVTFEGQKVPAICNELVQEMVKVKSHDGETVMMSLVYRKGLVKNGKNPVMLIGYGSYGTTLEPAYWDSDGAFLAKGGIKAVAHVRGGGAFGERWRLAGFRENKPNTWKDFIACADALVEQKYASAKTICASGRSAGGITVGRAITEKPEAFGAALIGVGLVDVVRAETTPNGVPNIPEFGSVNTEKGFRDILAMSAYHHVKKGVRYPPVMIYHGANDTRVEPWQSMKLAARMHAALEGIENPAPVLLRIDYKAGHGRGGTARQRHELSADLYGFLYTHCGGSN